MATKPKIVTLSNSSVDVLNAIRNSASINYRDYVPVATADSDSIREIGATIMDYPALQNEFLNALVNRIGRVILTSKSYQNPWAMFKKGFLEFGETIEEVFTNLAKPFQFDPAVAENEIFKREIPDVRSAFHVLNYQKFYKATVSQEQLRMAFMSWDGVTSLISSIVESMYTAANYDEFITMKYLLCRRILSGQMYWANPSSTSQAAGKDIVKSIRMNSDNLTFLSPDYNLAGVYNSTEKNNQYIIIPSKWMAEFDVEVLAAAFNMNKVEFMGHVVLVDSFSNLDFERLRELFKDDPAYKGFGASDLEALDLVAAVLVDKDYFMIFDNLQNFTENYNGQGLYWNYFYHVWKTFSTSPYANAILFTSGNAGSWDGASITVTPSSTTLYPEESVQLKARITGAPAFASKNIDWESSSPAVTVDKRGIATLVMQPSTVTQITITAKAHAHPETTGTATINVG